jgi:predicted phosphodiesterase
MRTMSTVFLVIGDLHYGFDGYTDYILEEFFSGLDDDFDIVIDVGDTVQAYYLFEPALKMLRKYIPDKPILTILGNHDIWQYPKATLSYLEVVSKIRNVFEKFDIHYLEDGPYTGTDFTVHGYDGWYWNPRPETRDLQFMPEFIEGVPVHEYLYNKNVAKINMLNRTIEKNTGKKIIMVSHFDMSGHSLAGDIRWLDMIRNKADILCHGHSHKFAFIDNDNDMRVYNPGSDYNDPGSIIFEV